LDRKEVIMASKKIQKIVDKFVADIVAVAEAEAMDVIQARLGKALSGPVVPKVKRRKSSRKGKSNLKPCPIKGCKETAAPRWMMVCKEHKESCTREQIVLARDVAERPGGIWFEAKKKSA
jgi:hypothetical protein